MRTSTITQASATGDVTTVTSYLRAAVLTAGSDQATLTVRAGGSTGTVVLTVKAAANATAEVAALADAQCGDGIHVTLSGTGPVASLVYS